MDLEQQKKAHIEHLRDKGFDITDLTVGSEKYISCPHIGAKSPKRIACYKTFINEKPGGGISLFTNYKTAAEEWSKFTTNNQTIKPKKTEQNVFSDSLLKVPFQEDTEFDF
jgi:hypothetical protein